MSSASCYFLLLDPVLHPYKTIGKIIALQIVFMVLNISLEDSRFWTEW